MGYNGPRAKKSLGQNFLQDNNIARKIVKALEINEGDNILEVGPGPGALTSLLRLEPYAKFIVLEKDNHWAFEHANIFCDGIVSSSLDDAFHRITNGGSAVVANDALRTPWESLAGEKWKIIGNLPYNIASPLMWDIVSKAEVERAVFMVQKEVAERITAQPGSSSYGALSVWIQSFVTSKYLFTVPPQVFYPRPKVNSAVISFFPLEKEASAFDKKHLKQILDKAFQQRRKQLGTIFKGCDSLLNALDLLGIKREQRPESLTPLQFHKLSLQLFI